MSQIMPALLRLNLTKPESKSGCFALQPSIQHKDIPQMNIKPFTRTIALLGFASLSIGVAACNSASSQGLSSRNFDKVPAAKTSNPKSQPASVTPPTLNLVLSVDAAYAAIPHKRTAMDFAASNMNDQDKRFLEVAFHLIDQAIRLRVTTYQKFSRGEFEDTSLSSDVDRLIEYLQNTEAPANLSNYQEQLLRAFSDQKAFFEEWKIEGQQFQYGSPQTIATHPKVQSASTALRAAYGLLMQAYTGESDRNKVAFFDYHCALDFI
jgi:hypothetical protein